MATAADLPKTGELQSMFLDDFSAGLNTQKAAQKLHPNQSPNAENGYIDEKPQSIVKRDGMSLVGSTNTLNKVNFLFEFKPETGNNGFFVSDSSAILYTTDFMNWVLISTGLTSTAKLRAAQGRGVAMFVNGTDAVRISSGLPAIVLDGTGGMPNVPRGAFVAYNLERFFVFVTTNNKSQLSWQALTSTDGFTVPVTDVRAWPVINTLGVGQGDGLSGSGLDVYRGQLQMHKSSRSIYTLFGNLDINFIARKTNAHSGASVQESIVQADNLEYYFEKQGGVNAFDGSDSTRISDDIFPDMQAVASNLANITGYTWDTKAQFDRGSQIDKTTTTSDGLVKAYTQPQFLNFGPDTSTNPVNNFVKPLNSASTSTHWMVIVPTVTIDANFPGTLDGTPFVGLQVVALTFYTRCTGGTAGGGDLLNFFMQNDAIGISNQSSAGGVGLGGPNCSAPEQIVHSNVWWTTSSTFTGRDIANGKLKIKAELINTGSANYEIFVPTTAGNAQIMALPVSTGQYISEVSTFTPLTFWDTFQAVQNTGGQHINYFIRGATSAVNIATETWVSISPGNVIPLSVSKPFAQWAATFSAVMFSTVNIDQVTINRNNGGSSDSSPFGIEWKKRYLLFVTTATDGTNTICYVKSKISNATPNAWMRFTFNNDYFKAVSRLNDNIYLGSGSSGKIYRFDYGTNDNGSPINWFYETPDLNMGADFFKKKQLEYLIDIDKESGANLLIKTSIDSGVSYSTMSISINGTGPLMRSIKNVFPTLGKNFRYHFENQELDKSITFNTWGVLYENTAVRD